MKKTVLLIIFFLLATNPLLAQENNKFHRTILALYDSTDDISIKEDSNRIHFNAEMVLNYLGMKIRYHDMSKGLPSKEKSENIYGILTWYRDEYMKNPIEYCRWIKTKVSEGKKLVILGRIGAYKDFHSKKEIPDKYIDELLRSISLDYEGSWTDNPFVIEVIQKNSQMVEFERTLDEEIGYYELIKSIQEENNIYLSLKRTDMDDSESAVVVTTPQGGFAMESYVLFSDPLTGKRRWRINPFSFFEKAFQLENKPKFDTTTLFGRRIAYSHIDGDGLRNISEIDSKSYSGEIILNEILKKYPFPITVSFIAADVHPKHYGSKKLTEIAKGMLIRPNVEIGVHGYTHPLDWEKQLTEMTIKGYSQRTTEKPTQKLISESYYTDPAIVHAPRQDFLNKEIKEATNYLNTHLAPQGKRVVINQWTGNCEPPAEAIDITNQMGLKNINRGDTLFDRAHPTYTKVAPLVRHVDGRIQIHTSNSNENIYTHGWLGNFHAFKYIIETFQQTEYPSLIDNIPRRITPMNIYYHFYSGEKILSLNALKDAYHYLMNQKITPIFTSEYVSVVEGFLSGTIKRIEKNAWIFKDYGTCRTVRFDNMNMFPDLEKSKGILGFNQWENFLYVHLDAKNEAVLYLAKHLPGKVYLQESSSILFEYQINKDKISFLTKGFGDNTYVFNNLRSKSKHIILVKSKKTNKIKKYIFRSDQEGQLDINIPIQNEVQINIMRE